MFWMQSAREKLQATRSLFDGSTTTIEKIHSTILLVKGVHPRIDALIAECEVHVSALQKLQAGSIVELSLDQLPENTEEEKKRKKVLLLFIKSWGELKNEIARVQNELQSNQQAPSQASTWWRIFSYAKGPLALVTVIAVLLAVMQTTSVTITIFNRGCSTLYPSTSIPISMPGLSLPHVPIASGMSGVVTIPPLLISVDGTSGDSLRISSLAFKMTLQLSSSIRDVTFDGASLLGKKTTVRLADAQSHTLIMTCQ